jgi:hypothetical protein
MPEAGRHPVHIRGVRNMARITAWDDAYLKQCESENSDRAFNAARGFASCPSAKCRRARRCVGDATACGAPLRIGLPSDIEQNPYEEIDREIQQQRRDAVLGMDEEMTLAWLAQFRF